MNWWVIGFLVVLGLFLFRAKEIKHRIGLIIISFLLIFLALSLYQIYSFNSVDLSTFDGVISAGKLYVSWLGTVFNSAKEVTSYAVHQDWALNVTNSSAP